MSNKIKYEGYAIGSVVYAISEYKQKDIKGHSPYVAIYKAIVKDLWFSIDDKTNKPKIEYGLTTPAGVEWGNVVEGIHVSDDIQDLVDFMKPIWETNSNTH